MAVGSVVAAWALRLALSGILGTTVPYITLFPAVVFAAWSGGLGPAILATALSVSAAAFLLVPPIFHLALTTQAEIARTVIFVLGSSLVSVLVDALRNSRASLEQRGSQLEEGISRLQQTELALTKSNAEAERARDLLLTTLSSIGDAVIATDAKGFVTFLNTVAEELTGWKQAEAVGRPVAEIFVIQNESTGLPVEDPIAKAIRAGAAVNLANHSRLVGRRGLKISIEDTAAPILDATHRVLGAVLVFRDVTERRRAEISIQQSEERLALALNAGKIAAWDWSVLEDRITWSDHAYAMHGVEVGSLDLASMDGFLRFVHPEDQERFLESIQATLSEGASYDHSFRILRPTKDVRWISVIGSVLRNNDGVAIRMYGASRDITEEKQTEDRILQQWRIFDTALSNTPDHHYILDTKGHFTYANRALLNLWQRTLGDVTGKGFPDLDHPPELTAQLHRQIEEVIRTKETLRSEADFTSLSGETRSYEYVLVPVTAAEGPVVAISGSSHDVTDRKQNEQKMQENEERLNLALEAGGGVGTWDWDIPRDRVYSNQRFAEYFSIQPEIVASGAPIALFLSHVHPDDLDRVEASIRTAFETGGEFTTECRIVRSEGVRWLYARGRCHLDESGNPARFPGVAFDITDRKQAEDELRKSQQRLRAIYDGTCEFMGLLAPDGTLLDANRSSLEFANATRDELVGRKFWDTPWFSFTPGAGEMVKDAISRAAKGEFIRFDAFIMGPLGQRANFDISFHPVRNDRGEVVLIVPEGRDITELKQVEERLRRLNEELMRVNRDLEEFAYVASHDLQEPLRMVNIQTQLMMKEIGCGNSKLNERACLVKQGVQRMDALIKALLDFSRTVHLTQPADSEADLEIALSEALSLLKLQIEETNAVITRRPMPIAQGDTAQFVHLFQNLISNGLKYRQAHVPPQITISANQQAQEWIISVEDNGIGFDQEHADQIFGLFKRLHGEELPGAGLGLAICQRIVERCKGRIWAESTPGIGSTFHVALLATGAGGADVPAPVEIPTLYKVANTSHDLS